ncbi:lysine-sensitive aspartokinase 3 [Geothrix sp. PMB-07]|uniref:lysine-sensitive aspartokinase 3 n=1 Tax=Geothrix sp. PMB-07 TaxID=3068640 RepID=UPI002741221B|nr:lysine-sensitive aspartokinase 3 [Geothrix sp. PMB-07]WLT31743.1 lysine-sensitive aspartokinase 3 [Geothrix sp. PMB-07]
MIVLKFGGSSVADAACMRQVAKLAEAALPKAPLVVLSAMGKTTNGLFDAAKAAEAGDLAEAMSRQRALMAAHRKAAEELFDGVVPESLDVALTDLFGELELLLRGVAMLRELSARSMDAIASLGERLSTRIFAAFVGGAWVDARTVLRTNEVFGEAVPQQAAIRPLAEMHLKSQVGPGRVVVTQGYIGATEDGLTTTLGRGGSDYSAALFGAALDAEEVQIWTDVEGVLTCDPRIVPDALPIPDLSFAEAAELAAFGAKVLHPATIQPAVEARIPVTVRHTQKPEGRFTTISAEVRSGGPITALASRGPVTVLTVSSTRMLAQSGFLARLFEVFGRRGVSVDLVATAEVSVSLTVEADVPLKPLLQDLSAFATVEIHEGRAIIAAVGERLKSTPGLGAKLLTALGDINVEMISMGANEINLSLVVQEERTAEALRRLHQVLVGTPS